MGKKQKKNLLHYYSYVCNNSNMNVFPHYCLEVVANNGETSLEVEI